jgi:hypothetical protein
VSELGSGNEPKHLVGNLMIIDPLSAAKFIAVYKALLLEIDRTGQDRRKSNLIKRLVAARSRLSSEPSLINRALAALKSKSVAVDPEVVGALRSLEVANWVFLRDTKAHSIFVHPSEHRAYGVLGLNDRIRDIAGGVGVFIETGLVQYGGRFVCDGLIARILWLGKNYRNDFNRVYQGIRSEGKFYSSYGS